MTETNEAVTETQNGDLAQVTIRIRTDQKNRLDIERRARGAKLADVIRDNLDLAFAMKGEMSNIVEGQIDANDPTTTPRLVHSLLFRVEERILGALDGLAQRFDDCLGDGSRAGKSNAARPASTSTVSADENEAGISKTVDEFVSLIANTAHHPAEVWIGAFLEILPRIELVGSEQLDELKEKGELWLEEHGYYIANTPSRT